MPSTSKQTIFSPETLMIGKVKVNGEVRIFGYANHSRGVNHDTVYLNATGPVTAVDIKPRDFRDRSDQRLVIGRIDIETGRGIHIGLSDGFFDFCGAVRGEWWDW